MRRVSLFLISIAFLFTANLSAEEPPGNYSFQDIVKKERFAIVNIRSNAVAREGNSPLKDYFRIGKYLEDELKKGSLGTGFIIDPSGFILSNYHVIAPPPRYQIVEEITVHLADGREFQASVIGADKKLDIALLQIKDDLPFPSVTLGNSKTLHIAEWVMAVGNAFGIEEAITVGVVSGTGRILGAGPYDQFIQTDAIIHAGNTGGPLYNLRGEVIGINTTVSMAGRGIGFAIPINMVKQVLPMLRQDGKVTRGWLGVMIQTLTRDLARAFRFKEGEGALIADVMQHSPAETAGVKRGDIVVGFDGNSVKKVHDLPTLVAHTPVGSTVILDVIREGSPLAIKITIERLKED